MIGRITYGAAVGLHGVAGVVVLGASIAVGAAHGGLGAFWVTAFIAIPAAVWAIAALALLGLRGGRAGFLWAILPIAWVTILALETFFVIVAAFSYG